MSGTVGFSREQLYSTASYQQRNLRGIDFSTNNLQGWSLRGQDLTNARFGSSRLADADFTDAVIAGVDFGSTTSNGFTKEQFYTTVSYRERNLHGINLAFNDLSGWDFHGQDLSQVTLGTTRITGAILTDAFWGRRTSSSSFTTIVRKRAGSRRPCPWCDDPRVRSSLRILPRCGSEKTSNDPLPSQTAISFA